MIILPGPASPDLAKRLGMRLNTPIIPVSFKKFPDGESCLRIEGNVKGRDIIIVQTTSPPQNEKMMQLFLLASTAKDHDASTINTVIPYFAYCRQDKVFLPGESFSAKIIINLLKACGVNKIITINAHNPQTLRNFGVEIMDLSAISLLAEYFKNTRCKNAVSISMGKKGLLTAKEADVILKGGFDYIPTRRDRKTGKVSIEKKKLNVKKKIAILFDDIISSGGTMIRAVSHVKNEGAKNVYVACVHPLLTNEVKNKIINAGADLIVGTDSVSSMHESRSFNIVSVAPIIARALLEEPQS